MFYYYGLFWELIWRGITGTLWLCFNIVTAPFLWCWGIIEDEGFAAFLFITFFCGGALAMAGAIGYAVYDDVTYSKPAGPADFALLQQNDPTCTINTLQRRQKDDKSGVIARKHIRLVIEDCKKYREAEAVKATQKGLMP